MKYFVLKHMEENRQRLTSPDFAIGGRSGLLMTKDLSALLFTSAQSATSFLKKHNLEGFRSYCPDQRTGDLLAILADVDHCTSALVDGADKIAFLSCYTGAYVLPGHFYRHMAGGYEALESDDQWHPVSMDLSRPICACGGLLGAWAPWYVPGAPLDESFGVHQVIVGSYVRPDEKGYDSIIRVDLSSPESDWRLEVLLKAEDGEEVISYDLSSQGFTPLGSELESVEPWYICPITRLVSIGLPRINCSRGLISIELRGIAGKRSAVVKIDNLPITFPESANAEAGKQLERLNVGAGAVR